MPTTRSAKESRLYLDLHPCSSCGEPSFEPAHSLIQRGEGLVAVYDGACPNCGAARHFEFELAEEVVPADQYGGARPSAIIDAGEFLFASQRYNDLAFTRSQEGTAEALATVVPLLRESVAALTEVFKFIPEGADEVPACAITSEVGKGLYAGNPYRFHRDHLQFELETSLGLLADYQS